MGKKKMVHLRISGIYLSVIPWTQTVKAVGSQENSIEGKMLEQLFPGLVEVWIVAKVNSQAVMLGSLLYM